MNIIQKKKKRSQLIAEEIDNDIKIYDEALNESKQILDLSEREYQITLTNALTKRDDRKKNVVLRLGKILQKNPRFENHKISAKLKTDLKGYLDRNMIYRFALYEWRDKSYNRNPEGGRNRSQNQNLSTKIRSTEAAALTPQQEEIVEFHEEKIHHNEHIEALIDYLLGLSEDEKTDIIKQTPKGTDYKKIMIENARTNMLKIAKGLNPTDIAPFLADIRFLEEIHSVFSDILYEEQQLRKKNKEMIGK